jgi:hypothetical protein
MLELIGFWFVVSVITMAMSIPVLGVVYGVIVAAAKQALPEKEARKLSTFLYGEYDTRAVLGTTYFSDGRQVSSDRYQEDLESCFSYYLQTKKEYGAGETGVRLLGKKIPDLRNLLVVGAILWVAYIVAHFWTGSLLSTVIFVSTWLSPVSGYVGVAVGAYLALVVLLKVLYKGSVFVSKVNTHLGDKEQHNEKVNKESPPQDGE